MIGAHVAEFKTPCCQATVLLASGSRCSYPLQWASVRCSSCSCTYTVERDVPGEWIEADTTFPDYSGYIDGGDGCHFWAYPPGVVAPKDLLGWPPEGAGSDR